MGAMLAIDLSKSLVSLETPRLDRRVMDSVSSDLVSRNLSVDQPGETRIPLLDGLDQPLFIIAHALYSSPPRPPPTPPRIRSDDQYRDLK